MNYTPDKIKPQILMYLMMANGIVMMLPENAKKSVKEFLDITNGLVNKDWFLDLLSYLLNTFEDGKVTKEEFMNALDHFVQEIKADSNAPLMFKK